jgi:ectoine hydroxylase-related dioxygenase (phytanoyl-CoA dioxygenase family)
MTPTPVDPSYVKDVSQQLIRDGFALCPQVLDAEQVARYRAEACHLYDEEQRQIAAGQRDGDADYLMYRDYGDHIFNLARKTRGFDALYEHPLVIETLRATLKSRFVLTQTEMRRPRKQVANGSANVFHRDGRVLLDADLWVVAFWILEDVTLANGPTYMVPGSHRRDLGGDPEDGRAVPVLAKAGDLCFMNANTLHKAGPKLDDSSRWVLIITYNQWYLKPAVDHTRIFSPDEVDEMSPTLRELFGYTSMPPADERKRMYTCRPWEEVRSELLLPASHNAGAPAHRAAS